MNTGANLFPSNAGAVQPPTSNFNVENFTVLSIKTRGIGNDIFGSQAATAVRENKTKTQADIDDFLFELPENEMPELALGDDLIQSLGVETNDLFDENSPSTKKEEEEDEVLKNLMDEYQLEDIKDSMDETGQVPESIYFFYGGESQVFVDALEFIGLSPINKESGAFLLSDLGRQTMTQNKLSIHVGSGDTFYNNHNTGENF